MSILWSDIFYGNGDGDVMTGPFRGIRTILGGPLIRNIGTGMELLFVNFVVDVVVVFVVDVVIVVVVVLYPLGQRGLLFISRSKVFNVMY